MNYFLDPQNDLNKLSIVSTIKQKRDLASLSVSKYCLVCRVSKSVDIKFVIQAE